nr:hypothetical protein [Tanacetum cinerariifolium]
EKFIKELAQLAMIESARTKQTKTLKHKKASSSSTNENYEKVMDRKKTVEVHGVTSQDALRMKPPWIPQIGIKHRLKGVQTFDLM